MPKKSPYQTLKGLKEKSYILWCSLHEIEEQFGATFNEQYVRFKQTIRSQFGDLRYKVTWERAWAKLDVALTWQTLDDSSFLVRSFTEFAPQEGWDHLVPYVLDALLQYDNALACLKLGFERIVQLSPNSNFHRERQLFHDIQEAIERQTTTRGRSLAAAA
jgi:hypothetical protein